MAMIMKMMSTRLVSYKMVVLDMKMKTKNTINYQIGSWNRYSHHWSWSWIFNHTQIWILGVVRSKRRRREQEKRLRRQTPPSSSLFSITMNTIYDNENAK